MFSDYFFKEEQMKKEEKIWIENIKLWFIFIF